MTDKDNNITETKYYPEFHRLFLGNVVEVCEGRGTKEDPCRLVYYVHDEKGNFIGRLDTVSSIRGLEEEGENE